MAVEIRIVDYDPIWPSLFEAHADRIREVLGEQAILVEHVGSTSVPGLAAKPIIDITLAVPDSANESDYSGPLEEAGYALHIREPEWFEHRMFRDAERTVHIHVFSRGCPEIGRMLVFRNWLRTNAADRELYQRTKRELAQRNWCRTQEYADAKTSVIKEILDRAFCSTETTDRLL